MPTATKAKPKIKIHPLEDRVVILPDDETAQMRGGLYIPDTAKEKPTQGEVIAVGPGRLEKGQRVPMELKVGDRVIYGKYSGTPFVTEEGEEVIIIKASDVLAKVG
jgi:chaperonin GroES